MVGGTAKSGAPGLIERSLVAFLRRGHAVQAARARAVSGSRGMHGCSGLWSSKNQTELSPHHADWVGASPQPSREHHPVSPILEQAA